MTIKKKFNKPQQQSHQPGDEYKMNPEPEYIKPHYIGSEKLKDKVAIITGGDSGIGRAVAIAFSKEGADIAIQYLDEHKDAALTKKIIEESGRRCHLIAGDLRSVQFCKSIIKKTIKHFGKIDIVVNNAAEHFPQVSVEDINAKQLEDTFRVNVFPFFHIIRAALPHLKKGSSIINTASVTAYRGSEHLLDYSATKGAIVTFTRSLSKMLIKKGIYVNAVAPGPIWTPLITSSFTSKEVKAFGTNTPMGRAGQPSEVAPCYVFLASTDASYMTGQVLHPNGGEIINT
ncbi:MAG: NAD(P)-dependent oxidoreductase [Methylophilaceae bacterium 17-44-8]|nr:MAG: NAD(P)-dependent oxidoreductase [Methylophilales bacterium 28-44-11]OZA06977.1 MAG: NAD(P)-dependent oxidoreductase [Methylophilaceae bacterium 17-44-8]